MSHPDEARLVALEDRELSAAEAAAVREHLERCAECRTQLELVRRLKAEALDLIGALELPEPAMAAAEMPMFQRAAAPRAAPAPTGSAGPPAFVSAPAKSSRRWVAGLAWAATILLAVGIGYSAGSLRRQSAPTMALQRESIPPAAQSADQAAPAPVTLAPPPAEPPKTAGAETRRDAASARPAPATPLAASRVAAAEREKAAAPPASAAPLRDEVADRKVELDKEKKDVAANERAIGENRLARRAAKTAALDEVVVSGAAASASRTVVVPADSAIRTLGGAIKLVDGLVADHYEQQGPLVRVVYRVPWGSLVLEQRRMDTGLQFQLIAPSGAPADSVDAWRARIK